MKLSLIVNTNHHQTTTVRCCPVSELRQSFNLIYINSFKHTLDLYDEEPFRLILHQADEKKELMFLTSKLIKSIRFI